MGSRRPLSVAMVHAGDTRRSEEEVSDLTSKGTSCDVVAMLGDRVESLAGRDLSWVSSWDGFGKCSLSGVLWCLFFLECDTGFDELDSIDSRGWCGKFTNVVGSAVSICDAGQ